MSNKRLLIIEDNDDVAEMLALYFRSQQYDVFRADTGPVGIEMARTKFPNLILLDVMLPEMDGYDVCQILRQKALTRFIPIIFLTQKDERSSKVRGLELGADDYITKPFDVEELRLRVRNSIDVATRDHLHETRTGLPTGPLVEEERERRRKFAELCSAMYFSINAYQPYIDVYGFMAGSDVFSFAASVVRNTISEHGTPQDFVGVLGDQFLVFTDAENPANLVETIQQRFVEGVSVYYSFTDVERGGLIVHSGTIQEAMMPLMTLAARVEPCFDPTITHAKRPF